MERVCLVLVLLIGCGGWRQVRATEIRAKPDHPTTVFVVRANDALLLDATSVSNGVLRGSPTRAWRVPATAFRVRSGESPVDLALRSDWIEQRPDDSAVAIEIKDIRYATVDQSGRDVAVVLGVAGLITAMVITAMVIAAHE